MQLAVKGFEMKDASTFLQTAKDSSVEKLLQKLSTWYLEKEGKIA